MGPWRQEQGTCRQPGGVSQVPMDAFGEKAPYRMSTAMLK